MNREPRALCVKVVRSRGSGIIGMDIRNIFIGLLICLLQFKIHKRKRLNTWQQKHLSLWGSDWTKFRTNLDSQFKSWLRDEINNLCLCLALKLASGIRSQHPAGKLEIRTVRTPVFNPESILEVVSSSTYHL